MAKHGWKHYIIEGIFYTFYGIVKYLPSPIGDLFRFMILRLFGAKIRSIYVREGVTFCFPYRVKIGKRTSLNEWVFIDGYGGVEIGNYCRIAHRCSIISEEHGIEDLSKPIYVQPKKTGKVVIEDGVWLGCGVTVLRGLRIGKGSVIGAGSVITNDIPPYSIAVGIPAKVIRKRGEEKIKK